MTIIIYLINSYRPDLIDLYLDTFLSVLSDHMKYYNQSNIQRVSLQPV